MTIWVVLLLLEGFLLFLGQRQIFPQMENYSRKTALFLSAPGTALHEGAHWIMCKILLVPTGRVELFRPRAQEDGGTQLGVVYHGQADPLRQALIAIAPLLLVPPLLLFLLVLFLGGGFLEDPLGTLISSAWWQKILLFYIFLSAGSAAFPSPGDHIPFFGAVLLALLAVAIFFLLPPESLVTLFKTVTLLLLPAALSALLQLLFLRFISQRL